MTSYLLPLAINGQLLKEGSSIPHMRKNYIVASPGSVSISVFFFFFFFVFFLSLAY